MLVPWADRRLWFIQARRGRRVVWGVVYDAGDPDSVALARRAIATLRSAGADCSALPASLPVVRVDRTLVWIARCDAAALIEHQALERAREAAALASLWRGGGQWIDFLRVAGVVLPAAFAYFTWSQVAALQALVAQILALVGER